MLKCWLNYLALLAGVTLFFVCFKGYYSMYVMLLALLLPVVSLLLSLPGMLTLRLSAGFPGEPEPARLSKTQPASLRLSAATRWLVPSGAVRATLTVHNGFTGERREECLILYPSARPQILEHSLTSNTCGGITCRFGKARAYDLLGLFWLPVSSRRRAGCRLTVMPTVYAPDMGLAPHRSPDSDGDRYSPHRPGYDPTELFGLRDYRPGDKLNRIDWKLSQKSGGLLVREASLPVSDRLLLLCDLSAGGVEADASMDVLATVSDYLCVNEAPFAIGYSREARLCFLDITDPADCYPALEQVMLSTDRQPLSLEPSGLYDPDAGFPSGVSRIAYICPQPEPMALGRLQELYPGVRLTIIHMLPLEKTGLPPEVQAVKIRAGKVGEDLDHMML